MRTPAVLHTLSCTGRENWAFAALLGEQVGRNPRQILERQKSSCVVGTGVICASYHAPNVVTRECYICRYNIDIFSPYQYTPQSLPMPCSQSFKCNNAGSLALLTVLCSIRRARHHRVQHSAQGQDSISSTARRSIRRHSLPGRGVSFNEHQKRFNRPLR